MQDQTAKRRNIATNAMIHTTALLDHLRALEALVEERAVAGNFVDDDFNDPTDPTPELKHLTPFMIGSLLDTHIPAIVAFVEDAGTPARKQVLLEVRRGG